MARNSNRGSEEKDSNKRHVKIRGRVPQEGQLLSPNMFNMFQIVTITLQVIISRFYQRFVQKTRGLLLHNRMKLHCLGQQRW